MGLYLRHSLGFFLQLTPCIELCLIPFAEWMFVCRKRLAMIGCAVFCAAASALFPVVLFYPADTKLLSLSLLANLYMLLMLLILVAAFFWIVRDSAEKKLFVVFLTLLYAMTQYVLANLFQAILGGRVSAEIYSPMDFTLYVVTTLVMFPLMVLLMWKVIRNYLGEIDFQNIRREFGATILLSLLYFVMLMVYSSITPLDYQLYWWHLMPTFLFTLVVLGIFYWFLFQESIHKRKESEYQRTLEIQRLQYQNITREMENASRTRHDARHYLLGLHEMLEKGETDGMKEYLSNIIERVDHRDNEFYCENQTINGLLQYYAGLAHDGDIRWEAQADCGELPIQATDLTVLLGNTLENALHACRAVKTGGWIRVQIGQIGGSLVIQADNACAKVYPSGRCQLGEGFLPAEAFLSGKLGGGYGLRSITLTAQKYGGDAGFRFDEETKTFTSRIRMNLHPEIL
ncbi:MAG: GHKL domain-containing protein [Lachnospiraceae bacterium]|nr:GHKL domain-containing protein [Lachnospiraceae bacterium]